MFRHLALIAVLLLPLSLFAEDPAEINFGIISTESSVNLKKDFDPLRADLEKCLGKEVKLYFAPDYTGVIEAMRFNKVQIGWFGNASAIDAVDRGNGEVFCQCVDKDGNPGYWSLIIVHKDSPIQNLDELIAKASEISFSMGDPQSTSGTLVPSYYAFGMKGFVPAKSFKALRSANHEANAMAVANKQVDASTFNTEALFRLEQKQPDSAKKIRAIWKSPLIAADPMVYRSDLSVGLKKKIADFFIAYGKSEEQRKAIEPLKWSGFKASTNEQLMPYRVMRILKEKAKIEGDTTMNAEQKQTKLAELSQKQTALEKQMKESEAAQKK